MELGRIQKAFVILDPPAFNLKSDEQCNDVPNQAESNLSKVMGLLQEIHELKY